MLLQYKLGQKYKKHDREYWMRVITETLRKTIQSEIVLETKPELTCSRNGWWRSPSLRSVRSVGHVIIARGGLAARFKVGKTTPGKHWGTGNRGLLITSGNANTWLLMFCHWAVQERSITPRFKPHHNHKPPAPHLTILDYDTRIRHIRSPAHPSKPLAKKKFDLLI